MSFAVARRARILLVAFGLLVVVTGSQIAQAAGRQTASTNAGGVTYPCCSGRAIFSIHNDPAGGSAVIGTAAQHTLYNAKVLCVTFLTGGVAYWGARVTSSKYAGTFVFWRVKAGGPGVGSVAGADFPRLTCYNGKNGKLVGQAYTITAGHITVT